MIIGIIPTNKLGSIIAHERETPINTANQLDE